MKKYAVLVVLLSLLFASIPGAVLAQSLDESNSATLYFVHGLAATSAGGATGQAVNVVLNDTLCLAKGVQFGQIAGPFNLPAGGYKLAISPSTSGCSSQAAIARTALSLKAGDNVSAVAHLSDKSQPALTPFVNFGGATIGTGFELQARPALVARNTSAVSPLNVVAAEGKDGGIRYTFKGLFTGQQLQWQATEGLWQVTFYRPNSFGGANALGTPLTKVERGLKLDTTYFFYAVGSAQTGSFTVIVQELPTP